MKILKLQTYDLPQKLPIDALVQITQDLDIEDIISSRRTNSEMLQYFENKNFLNSLSFQKIGVHVNNFNEMIKLYNYKFITLHSLKYFSLNECFYKCGAEKNLKYAYFFLEKGANNYDDFLISVCENGNIAGIDLALMFLSPRLITEGLVHKCILCAAKGGHLEILQRFNESAIFTDLFPEIANILVEYKQVEIIQWILECILKPDFIFNRCFFVDTLIRVAIKLDNFELVDLILSRENHHYFGELFTHCIEHATFKMFVHLVYHKCIQNFVISMHDRTVRDMVKFGRFDIIKFLHTSKIINFDQFQWDIMLLHSCLKKIDDSKLLEKNRKLLVEYCLFNGGKVYKTVVQYSIVEKSCDLIDYILRQEDITTNVQSKDYMTKVFMCERFLTLNPQASFLLIALVKIAEFSVFNLGGDINYDDLFFHACRCGNKDLLEKTISKGCNHYKSGACAALQSKHYLIANYLFDKWKEECAQIVEKISNF
jgi:hypothetical protein